MPFQQFLAWRGAWGASRKHQRHARQRICPFIAAYKTPIDRFWAGLQCFWCPVVRHLWWWLGGRPASGSVMHAMLRRGHSALVCPGGVRECLYMEHGREAVYLTKRTGFVRIALQHGASLLLLSACQALALFAAKDPRGDVLWPANMTSSRTALRACLCS